jgi:hypothetical protein
MKKDLNIFDTYSIEKRSEKWNNYLKTKNFMTHL